MLGATYQLVDLGIGGQPDHDETLMSTPGRSSPATDDPAEADRRDQHHTQSDADVELQGLRKAVVTRLTHCHEPEGSVEGVRYRTVLDGQAHSCSVEFHDVLPGRAQLPQHR